MGVCARRMGRWRANWRSTDGIEVRGSGGALVTAVDGVRRSATWLLRALTAFVHQPGWIADELLRTTLRRVSFVARAAIPVHVILLLTFWSMEVATVEEQRWRTGIMVSHGVLLILQSLAAGYALRARDRDPVTVSMRLARFATLALILAAGIVLAAVDQLVTPSVTPFLLACVIAGLVIMLPPLSALVGYLVGYIAYAVAIGVSQTDASVVASNRANGLAAVAIGVTLTVLMWRAESRDLRQREHIRRQQELLEASNRELAQLASFDPLTGLANRRALQLMLDNEVAQMRREGHTSSIVLFDADRFKLINDVHGHPAGDEVLRQLAQLLCQRLRGSDLASRWGGEEFLVLLPRTDLDGARILAEDLRAAIEQHTFDVGSVTLELTVSAGVTALDLRHFQPLVSAYREVDEALYRAKRDGRNRVAVAARDQADDATATRAGIGSAAPATETTTVDADG